MADEVRSTEMRRRRCLRQGDKARRKGRREQIRSILDAESSDDREDALDDAVVDTEQLDAVRRIAAAARPGPKPPAGKPPKQLLQTACVLAGKTKVACSKQPCAARLASGSVVPKVPANCHPAKAIDTTRAQQNTTGEGVGAESESAGKATVLLEVTFCRSWNHVLVPQGWELR